MPRTPSSSPSRRTTRHVFALTIVFTMAAVAVWLHDAGRDTDEEIARLHARVAEVAKGALHWHATDTAALPAPVQRYLRFVFPDGPVSHGAAVMHMEGRFRRPRSEDFVAARATQTAASALPAMMFDATIAMAPGITARAYDAYVDGRMTMKAKVLSAYSVVDEKGSPALDRISLRRWLLESPTYPQALLPGGPVTWAAVDEDTARATVRFRDMEASLLAHFAPDGALLSLEAEEDGDLDTPYHGSGEHVSRDDYRLIDGMRIPMRYAISRKAGGNILPFWSGRITHWQHIPSPARSSATVIEAAL